MDEGDLDFSRELICPKTAEFNSLKVYGRNFDVQHALSL